MDVYIGKNTHVIREVGKFQDIQSASWRPREVPVRKLATLDPQRANVSAQV